MMGRPKFKDFWVIQPDNSSALVQPSNQQIYIQNQFITNDWHQHCSEFYSLIKYLASPFPRNTTISTIETQSSLHQCINLMFNDQYVIVQVYNEYGASYKGFISWLLLANSNHCFLIDCISLRNSIDAIRKILEDTKIVKLVYDSFQVCKSFKRDFSIFIVNIFDLVCLETQYEGLAEMGPQMAKQLNDQLLENCELIIQRPMKSRLWKLINLNFKMSKNPTSKSDSEHRYLEYIMYKYQQFNQPSFTLQFYQHQIQKTLTKEEQDELDPRICKLYYSLISFRQHVAKMNDVSVNKILPKQVIDKILQNNKISVLEISQLYENLNCEKVSLELCKRIYDVIQLNEQLHEDSQKLKVQLFEKQLSGKKENIQNAVNIKKLLKDIQWGDSSEWLNRKDDPSIKLYKQIISIEQFDHSIGQQYLVSMREDVLKKRDLGKYLKYAQYMRSKNYEKLQNLYKMNQLIKQSNNKQDQFSQQTQCQTKPSNQKFGQKLFEQEENREQKVKSSTSLQQKVQKSMQQIPQQRIKSAFTKNQSSKQIHNIQQSSQNSKSRRSSQSSSISSLSQIDEMCIKRSDIKPLPDSIQQIYQLALQVKKKTQKKVNKKKQKKGKNDNTKESQFIPTWQDIQKLINYASNLK